MTQTITGAITAQAKMYADSCIEGYERSGSLLRSTLTTEVIKKGSVFYFNVEDSGNATATTRGFDSRILGRAMNNNQVSVTLNEYKDKVIETDFNIFTHQASASRVASMNKSVYKVLNRKVDDDIITALNTATKGPTNTATSDAFSLIHEGLANLGNNNVPVDDGNVFCLASPAFMSSLTQKNFFSSRDYVSDGKFNESTQNQSMFYDWNGVKIFIHTAAPVSGNTHYCFLYHKSAIGHAIDNENFTANFGYDEEDFYSYASVSTFTGTSLLQSSGIQKLKFDASGVQEVTIT